MSTSTSQSRVHSDSLTTSALQKRIRFSTGFIHKKKYCVWCMKIEDKKHRNCPSSKLLKIEQGSMRQDFKRHIPFIKETDIRRWYTYLIDSTHDPFAEDMLYHVGQMIGHEYVLHNLNKRLEDSHLQNVNIDNVRKLFFCHVDELIFRNREIRQLNWLLSD